jgi:hypothetical protein
MKLEDLPDEVLRQCFAYVGCQFEVLRLASLSKRFRPVVQQAGLHIIWLPSMAILSRYARLLARGAKQVDPSAVQFLAVDVVWQADESMAFSVLLPMVIRHHHNLVCLKTVHPKTTEDVDEFVAAIATLSRLRVLTISSYGDTPEPTSFEWQHVARIIGTCKRLRRLGIEFAAEPFQSLWPESVTCPELLSLSLSQRLRPGWLQEVLECTPNLQELRMTSVPDVLRGTSADTLVAILARQLRLEELYLPIVEDRVIETLLLGIPSAMRRLFFFPRLSIPWLPVAFFLAEQSRLRVNAKSPFDRLELLVQYWRLNLHDREKIMVGVRPLITASLKCA